jgi:NADH:ubiquinone oxidoreductase subunit 5 (subunit L)/multisubunit Na+/H+ antiporter MnhA subunit
MILWLLPLFPAVVGGVLLVVVRRFARTVSLGAAVVTLGLAGYAAVTRPSVTTRLLFREGLAVDGLSAVMVVTVAAVGLAVLVYASGDLRSGRFHGYMLIFIGAMLATVTATDLVLLLMAWEVMGAMSYALIGYWWHDPERVRSGTLAFVTTRAGDLGLYFAAGAAVAGGGGLVLGGLGEVAAPWRDLVAGGVVLAALGKSAQVPFSFWLSRAMAGPSPVSALLHSATMVVAGAYLLLRLQPLLAATGWAGAVVAWAGALTALLLGAVAVAQRDLKQLLAASTCAQAGFMVVAAGVSAVSGGTAHLVAHAAVKSLLFLGAGAWLGALGTKDLGELHGAARRYPLVGVLFGIGALALAGVPPLSLWVTKDAILRAVGGAGQGAVGGAGQAVGEGAVLGAVGGAALYAVVLAGALLAAAYSAKALVEVWRPADGETRAGIEQPATGEVGRWERAPLPVLALVAAVFGVVGLPGVFGGWSRLVGDPSAPAPTPGELAQSGALAIVVTLAVIARPPRTAALLSLVRGWWGLEAAARALVWRPLQALARGTAWFDDHVLDGAVNAVPRAGMAAARLARAPFEAGMEGIVQNVATVAGRLGTLARRPQTGQVHTYFAQAAFVLIALAVAFAILR